MYIYRDLAALLPEAQPVYGVQARALRSGEAAPTIPALADSYLDDVL
ncbi:MAG: hypothetical protein L6Q76_21810, partial [Polyangiaceae bacterium]|nr:hypothetical protein [Polyangiaceae bacterium]